MYLALHHLELSAALRTTDKAFWHHLEGLLLLGLASPRATCGVSWRNSSSTIQRRGCCGANSSGVTAPSWCPAPRGVPSPHEGPCPWWVPVVPAGGQQLSEQPCSPCWCVCCGSQAKLMFLVRCFGKLFFSSSEAACSV